MQLPVGSNGAELEERIIQHLAAAAAMGRAHHIARREGQRSRASGQGRPQFLVFSTHPSAPAGAVTASLAQRGGENEQAPAITVASPSAPLTVLGEQPSNQTPELSPVQDGQIPSSASGSTTLGSSQSGLSFNNRSSAGHSSPVNQDRAGPSEFQSFSESLKSRFNAVSMRYKDSISKSTRGWRERFFSRSTSMADLSTEVKREVNAGIARVSSMMERLETRQNSRATTASIPNNLEGSSVTEPNNQSIAENTRGSSPLNDSNTSTYCAASSGSH
uniref:E3 ubiquitin-protein ligase RHF2A-like n=1 Tax=Nelumbo nucifera TaxID=4432 RepID=A0A822ZTT0_NELNU|nr:TPA_asm: hypothetical protein HUJ06_018224 [Nelumbo nucifera]